MAQTAELALSGYYGTQAVRWRFNQVDRLGNVIADLTPAVGLQGDVTLDNTRAVGRTCTLQLDRAQLPASWLTAPATQQNVQVLYELLLNGAWQTYPQGIFWIDNPQETASAAARLITVRGSDLTNVLNSARDELTYVVPAGSDYLAQVAAIASMVGLQVGFGREGLLTPVDFTWAPHTSWLAIITDLLVGVNDYPLWADASGVLQTRAAVAPQSETAAVVYTTDAEPRTVLEPFVHGTDRSRPLNTLNVVIDDPTRTQGHVTLQNLDPTSIVSVPSLGYVASTELRGSGSGTGGTKCLLDLTTGLALAQTLLGFADCDAHPATLRTLPDPRRGAVEYYRLTVTSRDGTSVVSNQLYRVLGWTLPLAPGSAMTHRIERVNPLSLTL